jgi:hypothetical protein
MSTENTAGAGADASAVGSAAPGGSQGAQPGGTPTQAAADAAATQGGRTPEERIAYLEAEQKRLIEERQSWKQKALEQPEVKALAEKARKADELEAAAKRAEEEAALKRGEHEKLWQTEKARAEALAKERDEAIAMGKRLAEETERKLVAAAKRRALKAAATAAECVGLDALMKLAEDGHLDKLQVDEAGEITGVAEVIKSFQDGQPYLFKAKGGAGGAGPRPGAGGKPPTASKPTGNGPPSVGRSGLNRDEYLSRMRNLRGKDS